MATPPKQPARKPAPRPQAAVPPLDDRTDPGSPAPGVHVEPEAPAAGPGEATRVYDRNKLKARAEAPRLLVTAGPRKGGEFTLSDPRTTVGRGNDNVLVIPDISVSRRHVVLEQDGERWVVVDQGSGNGTRVNGKQIERLLLRHGDRIEIGDTVLQFIEPGGVVAPSAARAAPREVQAPAPAARGSALRRRGPLYATAFAGLLVLLLAGLVRQHRRARADAEAANANAENRALAQERFNEGKALLKQGKWAAARDRLRMAAELDGDDAELQRYLDTAETEAPRAQALAEARTALEQRDFATARRQLTAIPDESALAGAAGELKTQLQGAMTDAVRDARARAEAGDAEGARELIEPVLVAEPSRPDALAVREAVGESHHAAAPAVTRKPQKRAVAAAAPTPAQDAPPPDTGAILEAYLAGDLGAALQRASDAQSPRGERLLADLKQFDANYKDGLAKQQAHRAAEAIHAFETALALDRNIAGGREGRLGHEVRKALGTLHAQLGAALAGGEETLPQAAQHLRAAVQADPANEAAQSALRTVNDKAREIFTRGYVSKDTDADSARHDFRLVMLALLPSDETYQKAKRWLDKLDGKVAKDE